MGDTVQRLMEEMVPELEDLQKKEIFTKVRTHARTKASEHARTSKQAGQTAKCARGGHG